ncbi:uncharacterized protein LOC143469400 [Clavelina lepadiformis]|uniref:uncharacterized protein LOC143469400 n=1 Tax=Clavelina lepadiformis TaxID=159417 RepID=UPI004042EF78
MAEYSTLPKWLQEAKLLVQRSDEWMTFSKALYDVVSVHLHENGIKSFATLGPSEKTMLILKAVDAMKGETSYKDILAKISASLDGQLRHELQGSSHCQPNAKSELLAEKFQFAIEAILSKSPHTKAQLSQCANKSLDANLRYTLWKAKLENPQVRQSYLKLVENSPKKLVSKFDLEISQKCQSLLRDDDSLKPLQVLKPSSSVLRHVLSYHHAQSMSKSSLTDVEYLLAVPLVYCTLAKFSSGKNLKKPETLTRAAMATLIEQFELFWEKRPDFAKSPEPGRSMNAFAMEAIEALKEMDTNLMTSISEVYGKTFKVTENVAVRAIAILFQPLLRTFFVGYLPLVTVMFIWDQIIVGYDVKEYNPLPVVCAVLLYLARESIEECSSWRALENNFKSCLKTQDLAPVRGTLAQNNFDTKLEDVLDRENSLHRHYPVPTATALKSLPAWRCWYSDKLVAHFSEKRATKRAHFTAIQEAPETEDVESTKSLRNFRGEREHLIEELNLMKEELMEARKQIAERSREKEELEDRAETEIERLKKKLDLYRKRRSTVVTSHDAQLFGLSRPDYEESESSSLAGGIPPPPSIATAPKSPAASPVTPSPSKPASVREPTPVKVSEIETPPVTQEEAERSTVEDSNEKAKEVMKDLVRSIMQGIDRLAHGTGAERETLNAQTRSDLNVVRAAYEDAKTKVFGKPTTDEELAGIEEEERQNKISKVSDETRAQLKKRLK